MPFRVLHNAPWVGLCRGLSYTICMGCNHHPGANNNTANKGCQHKKEAFAAPQMLRSPVWGRRQRSIHSVPILVFFHPFSLHRNYREIVDFPSEKPVRQPDTATSCLNASSRARCNGIKKVTHSSHQCIRRRLLAEKGQNMERK